MKNPYKTRLMPRLTVDAWIRDRQGRVLLVQRGRPPFEGAWGLPGGFCEWKETTERCCVREAREETALSIKIVELRGVYSKPGRDPRGHNVTVLYAARPVRGQARGGDDARDARWFTESELRGLRFAFDHRTIVFEQLARDRAAARKPKRKGSRATPTRRRAASARKRGRGGLRR